MDTDAMLAALLAHWNTPASDTKVSPAEVVFGRKIKDLMPIAPGALRMNPEWHHMLEQRETALAK